MLITLLSFSEYLATKLVPLNNETCNAMPTVIDLNPIGLIKY